MNTLEDFIHDCVYMVYETKHSENRKEAMENALDYIREETVDHFTRFGEIKAWCEYEELPEKTARLLHQYGCCLQSVLEDMIEEQEEYDREATEEYHEREREYREVQGWK